MRLGEYTKSYFEKNKIHLEKNYPGINLNRIKYELYNLYRPHFLDRKEFFSTPYIATNLIPIEAFFMSLSRGVPLEYISGKKFFYQSEFQITSSVLIPRSETEILVEKSIEYLKNWNKKTDEKLKICDVGTGSGCIVLSVLRGSDFPVEAMALDISSEALDIAKRNYFNLKYSINKKSTCTFKKMDRLEEIDERFHLIMSNPPYIKEKNDFDLVHGQVFDYEPHLALFLKDLDYDKWFDDFFNQAFQSLYEDGIFIMEGHEHHLKEMKTKLERDSNIWKSVEIIKDFSDRDRFLLLKK